MNKEQQELLDDAYFKRYRLEAWGECDRSWLLELDGINLTTGEKGKVHRQLTQEEFINKCKTDSKFSKRWGLQIKERELSLEERCEWDSKKDNVRNTWGQTIQTFTPNEVRTWLNEKNVPTKLITITYKEQKIESYE